MKRKCLGACEKKANKKGQMKFVLREKEIDGSKTGINSQLSNWQINPLQLKYAIKRSLKINE